MIRKSFLVFLLLLLPVTLNAQAFVSLKLIDINNKEVVPLGDFERGKIWVDRKTKRVFLYNGESVKAFSIKEDVFFPVGEVVFNDALNVVNWQKEETGKEKKENVADKKLAPRFLWSSALRDTTISIATTDVNGEKLFIADADGDIHVFDIQSKDYEGKLRFLKKPIKFMKPLKNGGLIIVYDDSVIYYVERFKVPFFSFLQDLKSSYREKTKTRIPLNFISSFSVNESEDKLLLSGDHKTIVVLNLPTLSYTKLGEERLFIEFADFIDDNSIIYMTLKERGYFEQGTTFRNHFNFMANYFDVRREAVASPSGRFLTRVSDKGTLDIIDFDVPALLASIGLETKMFGELFYGNDNRTLIITDKKRERVSLYRLEEQKH